jgi:hypothetical protein
VLAALLGAGHDLPGDLILGEPMLQRAQGARLDQAHAVEERQRGRRYPALAALALAGEWVGSPCGGEQPKFGYCVRDAQGGYRHVLVKFTAAGESPAKRRWCELLLAEHHAAEALHAHGIAAARSHIVPGADRLFLEVARFDRVGEHGRRGCVSLAALAQAAPGERDDWRRAGANLWRGGWISREDATTLTTLYWFGALIANDDMHLGNVSFVRRERHPLALAPAYDMLPMRYRPAATGEIVARPFNPPLPPPTDLTEWSHARAAASECWQRIAAEARVSDSFREIARENAARLAHAQTQLR